MMLLVIGIAVPGFATSQTIAQKSAPRLFWGTAQIDAIGTQAVILCLDESAKVGKLFVPPQMEGLESFENVGERLRFKTGNVDDRVRSFDIRLQGRELRGTGEQLDLQRKEPTLSYSLVANEVTLSPQGIGPASLAFSNAGLVPETGDFIGNYLEIISTSDGDRGVFVSYHSPWHERTYFPYYLFEITRSEKIIRFQTQTPKGRVKYRVDLDGSVAKLWRDGENVGAFPMQATTPIARCPASK